VRIAVYALAKNEAKHVAEWAASCEDADLRIVTDTGSTDGTVEALEAAGVTVARGYVVPWRWDDAHNISLNHVPPDVDVCVRLDLDERLQPGWRQAIETAWHGEVNSLRYRYVWSWKPDGSPGLEFHCDRVHARHGFRWAQATHEGLICWAGEKRQAFCEGLEIHHHRDAGKKHKTDLFLLEVATREAPQDARAQWYLAREMDYAGHADTVAAFEKYLAMDGGSATERAYAHRVLYRWTGKEQHLHDSAREAQGEPDAWMHLALLNYRRREWRNVIGFARQAIASGAPMTHASDPHAKTKAFDLLGVALWELGRRPEALTAAREALSRLPDDQRLAANVAAMERILKAGTVEAA
jgi:glycosyltransferase involved in cell wall biosynthesis